MADGAAEDVVFLELTLQRAHSLGWAVSRGGLWVHASNWKNLQHMQVCVTASWDDSEEFLPSHGRVMVTVSYQDGRTQTPKSQILPYFTVWITLAICGSSLPPVVAQPVISTFN